jgi:hypothetical protein
MEWDRSSWRPSTLRHLGRVRYKHRSMASRSKKPLASKPGSKPKSDGKSMPRKSTGRVAEVLESSRQLGAVVEDMRAQNRATIEAVLNFREEFLRDRAENRERLDRLDNAILKLSSDVVVLKTDMQSVKAALTRVESKVDGKADAAALRTLEFRIGAIESSSPSA